jgi:hypothetical protein
MTPPQGFREVFLIVFSLLTLCFPSNGNNEAIDTPINTYCYIQMMDDNELVSSLVRWLVS